MRTRKVSMLIERTTYRKLEIEVEVPEGLSNEEIKERVLNEARATDYSQAWEVVDYNIAR